MVTADYVWMNGEFVAFEDAKVPVLTHALHYGTGVFEGVRCYETPRGPAVFRHAEHIDRLWKSSELYFMEIPFTKDEIRAATNELILRNEFKACYIRPLVYRGAGPMGLFPLNRRSRSRSRCGSGAPTSATRASRTACAPRCPPGGASARTR